MDKNCVILDDCLNVAKNIDSNSIDLIYLDPPFFTNKTQKQATKDRSKGRCTSCGAPQTMKTGASPVEAVQLIWLMLAPPAVFVLTEQKWKPELLMQ